MKTLLISNNFPPIIDGVGDYTFHLFNHLNKKEITTKVVCNNKEEIRRFVKQNQLEEQVFPIIQQWNLFSGFKIVNLAKKQQVNTILLEYVPFSFSKLGIPYFWFFVFIWARLNGLKTSIFFHEVGVRIWGYGINYFIRGVFQIILAWLLCTVTNFCFSNSMMGAKQLKPFKTNVIPVPSNFLKEKEVANKGLKENHQIVLSFLNRCDLVLLKSIDCLVRTKFPSLKLLLIGKSSAKHKTKIENEIEHLQLQNQVKIIEETSSYRIVEAFEIANIYVQIETISRIHEGGISTKSGAIMAALSMGSKIITTKGDMTDTNFFKDRENVHFVNYMSLEDLTNALETILVNPNYANQLSVSSILTYNQKASWENHVKIISKILVPSF